MFFCQAREWNPAPFSVPSPFWWQIPGSPPALERVHLCCVIRQPGIWVRGEGERVMRELNAAAWETATEPRVQPLARLLFSQIIPGCARRSGGKQRGGRAGEQIQAAAEECWLCNPEELNKALCLAVPSRPSHPLCIPYSTEISCYRTQILQGKHLAPDGSSSCFKISKYSSS